jgi:hypothetical protein
MFVNWFDSFQKGVSDMTVSVIDGRVQCEFTRQDSIDDGDATFHDLTGSNTYYVIMARSNGDLQPDGKYNYL